MKLQGKFVFISGDVKKKDDKTYCNVNAECIEDGDVVQLSTVPEVLAKMEKYKTYLFYCDVFSFMRDGKKQTGLSLIDVDVVK